MLYKGLAVIAYIAKATEMPEIAVKAKMSEMAKVSKMASLVRICPEVPTI